MSSVSKIEWTEATWNPVTGCTKISRGCEHCYAATLAKRLKAMGNPRYKNGFEVTIHRDLYEKPLEWKKPKIIFVNSMSDIFHDDIPTEVTLAIFETMNKAHWHVFQILTKRVDRLIALSRYIKWTPNIWMGVTVEDQSSIYRSDIIKQCGAITKFVSAEPLLESIRDIDLNGIDWIIVGGESGYGCRPLEVEWVKEIQVLAMQTNTAFFFKQWGGFQKGKNGSLLDGKEYKEFPHSFES